MEGHISNEPEWTWGWFAKGFTRSYTWPKAEGLSYPKSHDQVCHLNISAITFFIEKKSDHNYVYFSRWIAAQQKLPEPKSEECSEGAGIPGCAPSYRDQEKQIFGCEHYKRNCKLVAACCNKLFTCRFCHDKISDHTMER